jgi:tetratricopeptide (TPR) repeat protein
MIHYENSMKKATVLISVFLIAACLFGLDGVKGKYEDYIVIQFLLKEKKFAQAETLINSYLKKYSDDPFILTEKAAILSALKNDGNGAIKLLEKSKEIYPGYYYANYLHARLIFAKYYRKKNDKESVFRAVEYLKTSLEDNENYYDSYFLLGVILSEIGKYEESNKYFELSNRLLETPEAYFNMSANYHELKDSGGEIKTYKKILEFSPENTNILNILVRLYLREKNLESAVVYLERLAGLETGDKSLKSKLLLSEIYCRKQNYYRGYQILKKIDDKDKNEFYFHLLFEVLSGLNLNRKIIEVYYLLEKNDSILKKFNLNEFYSIIFAFGNLNEPGRAHSAALKFYDLANKNSLELKELIHFLECFSGNKEIEAEKTKFEPNIFFIIGLYKNLGKYDKSISLLKRLIEKKEEEAYYLELCNIYILQKKHEEAESLLKRLIKKYPSSILLKNFYAYHLATQNKELEAALTVSSHTLKKDGDNPANLDTYGYILFKLGKIDESMKYLKKAYEKLPLDSEIIEHFVDYYRIKKDFKKISEIYDKAIANEVDFKEELVEKIKKLEKN